MDYWRELLLQKLKVEIESATGWIQRPLAPEVMVRGSSLASWGSGLMPRGSWEPPPPQHTAQAPPGNKENLGEDVQKRDKKKVCLDSREGSMIKDFRVTWPVVMLKIEWIFLKLDLPFYILVYTSRTALSCGRNIACREHYDPISERVFLCKKVEVFQLKPLLQLMHNISWPI